jgi:hypothetical protein
MDLRLKSGGFKYRLGKLGQNTLKHAYNVLSKELDEEYKLETQRTMFENSFSKLLRGVACKIEYHRSFWIGKRNIDFFFPTLAGTPIKSEQEKRYRGLAIEIDGKIHDQYEKMQRDQSKYKLLHNLGIATIVVENHHFDCPAVISILNNLSRLPRIDTRAKRRLLRNIYLITLDSHRDFIERANIKRCKDVLEYLEGNGNERLY